MVRRSASIDHTHYEALRVTRTANLDELKTAYRAIALGCHPDKTADPDKVERFKRAAQAYAVLRDARRRAEYNAELALTRARCPACAGEGVTWKARGFTSRVAKTCQQCSGVGVL